MQAGLWMGQKGLGGWWSRWSLKQISGMTCGGLGGTDDVKATVVILSMAEIMRIEIDRMRRKMLLADKVVGACSVQCA